MRGRDDQGKQHLPFSFISRLIKGKEGSCRSHASRNHWPQVPRILFCFFLLKSKSSGIPTSRSSLFYTLNMYAGRILCACLVKILRLFQSKKASEYDYNEGEEVEEIISKCGHTRVHSEAHFGQKIHSYSHSNHTVSSHHCFHAHHSIIFNSVYIVIYLVRCTHLFIYVFQS